MASSSSSSFPMPFRSTPLPVSEVSPVMAGDGWELRGVTPSTPPLPPRELWDAGSRDGCWDCWGAGWSVGCGMRSGMQDVRWDVQMEYGMWDVEWDVGWDAGWRMGGRMG